MSKTTPTPQEAVRRKGFLIRITHRWSRILVVWLFVSAPVLLLIYRFVEPVFEASSTLRIEPVQRDLYAPARDDMMESRSVTPYLQTQVALITTDRVLGVAINSPEIVNLPVIKGFNDPRNDLRKMITVEIVKDAYLIKVALGLSNGDQAASIINAVVRSYLDYNTEFKRGRNADTRASLVVEQGKLRKEVDAKQAELKGEYQRSSSDKPRYKLSPKQPAKEKSPLEPVFSSITEEQSRQIAVEIINTEMNLIKAQALLETKQAIIEGGNDQRSGQTLVDLKRDVAALLRQKADLAKYFERMKVEKKPVNNDMFEATVVKYQLDILMKREELVTANLQQLDFEATQEIYRVRQVDPAAAPKKPTDNKRIEYMAIAPCIVLFLVLAECLLKPVEDDRISASERNRLAEGGLAI